MRRHRVIVTGRFCPEKISKKLKKKTGKKVEIIIFEDGDNKDKRITSKEGATNLGGDDSDHHTIILDKFSILYDGNCGNDNTIFTIFSDENANSCSIM